MHTAHNDKRTSCEEPLWIPFASSLSIGKFKTRVSETLQEYDEMSGKAKVLHHLPPPPEVLEDLLSGYYSCLQRMLDDPNVDPIVCATIAKVECPHPRKS
eukprot:5918223-Amphidinium_carterae.1